MNQLNENIKILADLLEKSNYTVALTGAGMADETDDTNFPNPGSGMWTMLDPDDFTIQRFKESPNTFFETGAPFFSMLEEVQPGKAHKILAELESRGLVKTIITKNIDGLHQEAGSKNVLEIYGTMKSASCVQCEMQVDTEDIAEEIEKGAPPLCPKCGENLKPDVVLFGEPLSHDYHAAKKEISRADLVIVTGTNIITSPTRDLLAENENLAIINTNPTSHDSKAKVVITDNPGSALKLLLEELDKR